jgi:hypothetical protein
MMFRPDEAFMRDFFGLESQHERAMRAERDRQSGISRPSLTEAQEKRIREIVREELAAAAREAQ